MSFQEIAVGVLIVLSSAVIIRQAWRTLKGNSGCGSGCGGCSSAEPAEVAQVPGRISLGIISPKR